MKKQLPIFSFLLVLIFFSSHVVGQTDDGWSFDEQIVTDRPDQTEAPSIVPQGWLQLEAGCQQAIDEPSEKSTTKNTLLPTTLLKFGLSKNFELRLITEYAQDHYSISNGDQKIDNQLEGVAPVLVGCKIRIREERGVLPKISIISHLELPYFGKESMRPQHITPRFRFLFAHTLNEHFSFSYNLGGEWEDGSSNSTFIYTASLAAAISDRLSMFAESYGFLREYSTADHRVDGGIIFLVNNNIQLDVSGGVGISDVSPDYFLSGGLSFRLNTLRMKEKNN